MSEWKECTVNDLVDINPESLNSNTISDFINYLDTGNITENKIDSIQYLKNDFPSRAKRIVKQDDIIYSTVRPNQLHYGFINNPVENMIVSTGFAVLRAKESCFSKFLYYFLSLSEITEYLSNVAEDSTSAYPAIRPEIITDLSILLPPLPTQIAIAELLSSLDDKIDLLTRQNVTLEALAQTYFRQWFVEEETPTGPLDSIADITMGQSPSGNSYNEDGRGIVFFQGRAEFGWRFPTIRLYTTSPQRMAKKGDILMSVRAPVGDINIASEDCCIGRGLASIRSVFPTFTLYAIKDQKDQLDIFNGEGTVFGSITKDGLNALEIPIPPEKKIIKFESKFSSLDEKIKMNSEQILTLQKLRDTLLPKLISGEVNVKL